MSLSRLNRAIAGWLRGRFRSGAPTGSPRRRGPTTHVIILDGTMSTLMTDFETNAGLTYKLLHETGSDVSVYYESGLQWSHWRRAGDVLLGRGINRQIRRAYGYLASRYRPGDTIFLMGYSRGAYAVRSLAGIVGFWACSRPRAQPSGTFVKCTDITRRGPQRCGPCLCPHALSRGCADRDDRRLGHGEIAGTERAGAVAV